MDIAFRDRFVRLWEKYFAGAALPVCLYYTDDDAWRQFLRPAKGHVCLIGQLARVRKGKTLSVERDSLALECAGHVGVVAGHLALRAPGSTCPRHHHPEERQTRKPRGR